MERRRTTHLMCPLVHTGHHVDMLQKATLCKLLAGNVGHAEMDLQRCTRARAERFAYCMLSYIIC